MRDTIDDTIVVTKRKLKPPSWYTVVFLNDDYTPMEFVIHMLVQVFHVPYGDAVALMLKIHYDGKANIGCFTYEVADQKVSQVIELAKRAKHPLVAFVEKI